MNKPEQGNETAEWRGLYQSARDLLRKGKVDEGLRAAQSALRAARTASQAVVVARLIVRWDRFGDAGYCYDKALSIDPTFRPARYRIGRYASLDIARAREHAGVWDRVWSRLEAWQKIRDRCPQGEGVEEAVVRLRGHLEEYMQRREAEGGSGAGQHLLGVVHGPFRARRFAYKHPRDQGPGPYRRWTAVCYREAELAAGGGRGPWGDEQQAGSGDPLSRAAAFRQLEEAVRTCWNGDRS